MICPIRKFVIKPLCLKIDKFALRYVSNTKTFVDKTTLEQPIMTMDEVKNFLTQDMGIERGFKPLLKSRSHLMKLLPKSQDELPPRIMKNSFSVAMIPLTKDIYLQESFISTEGRYRYDKMIEEADIFAIYVANKYILNPKRKEGDIAPHVLATIQVNDITSYIPIQHHFIADIILSGYVTWVGRSSLEVAVHIHEFSNNKLRLSMETIFLIAARNSIFSGPTFVNRLVPTEEAELEVVRCGTMRLIERVECERQSLLKVLPNREEQEVIHTLYLSTVVIKNNVYQRILPPNSCWMQDAQYGNFIYCFPEFHNVFNLMFGGYLLRHAAILSYKACTLYSKSNASLCAMTAAVFRKPFYVGAIAKMHAHIVYTEKNYVQVAVYTDAITSVTEPPHQALSLHFTYVLDEIVPNIMPRTYMDAMLYIEGMRYFQKCPKSIKESSSSP